eukprot:7395540-Pyramimonas_sp.AAC.1
MDILVSPMFAVADASPPLLLVLVSKCTDLHVRRERADVRVHDREWDHSGLSGFWCSLCDRLPRLLSGHRQNIHFWRGL